MAAIGLTIVYRIAPNQARALVTWGAAAATAPWVMASAAFSLHVTTQGAYGEIYGP